MTAEAPPALSTSDGAASTVVIDFDALSVLDVMDLEDTLDVSITDIQGMINDPAARKGKVLAAFVWVMLRKGEPAITLREAAGRVQLSQFTAATGGAETPLAPTDAPPTTDV